MSLLKDISNKITETAKVAAKKSTDIVDITKLSLQIDKEQKVIDNEMYKIGKAIIENHSEDKWVEEKFSDKIAEIKVVEEKIETLKKEVQKLKNIKACEACGADIDKEAVFCTKCGKRF